MKKTNLFLSFRTQAVLSFLLITVLIFSCCAGILYNGINEVEQKDTEATAIREFRQIELSITKLTSDVNSISSSIALSSDVQNFILDDYRTEYDEYVLKRNILTQMNSMMENYSFLDSIYIFTENGKILGISKKLVCSDAEGKKSAAFYQSPLYRKTKESYPATTWSAGDKELYEDRLTTEEADRTFLSASKALKWLYGSGQSATLVVNICADALSSGYQYLPNYKNSRMYLADQNGTILSDLQDRCIGTTSPVYASIPSGQASGSYTAAPNNTQEQVVFYRLSHTGWTFVQEVPLADYQEKTHFIGNQIMWAILLGICASFLVSSLLMHRMTRPLTALSEAMEEMKNGKIGKHIDRRYRNEFGTLVDGFNSMSHSIACLIEQNRQEEEQKRVFEIEALQAQINPHFLFNTLNFIKWMAMSQNANSVADAISSLGNMLIPIFRDTGSFTTVRGELQYINNYFHLINLRFGGGIQVEYEVEETLRDCSIPKFILQPVVENCCSHAFENMMAGNRIRISGSFSGTDAELSVEDNGRGIPAEKLGKIRCELEEAADSRPEGGSIGLVNVNSRLRLTYGPGYGVTVESDGKNGTKVQMRFRASPGGGK